MEKKICSKCQDEKLLKEFYYNRQRKKYMNSCKSCNSNACKNYQQKQRENDNINFILSSRASGIRRDKKLKQISVAKNLGKLLIEQYNKQRGKCFYSGEEMEIHGYHSNNLAMTVDRIKPENGYIEGNVVLCCGVVNKIKTSLSINELFDWVEKIKKYSVKNETF